jgi:hypothetical protein
VQARQRLGFKGPVWKVLEKADDSSPARELEFDGEGVQVTPARRSSRREQSAGLSIEVDRIDRFDLWSTEGINGVAFFTRGASFAETTYDATGAPVVTILKGENQEEFSRIQYVSDDSGRVKEVRQQSQRKSAAQQFASALVGLAPVDAEHAAIASALHGDDLRIAFEYNEPGQVISKSTYYGENLHEKLLWTYNENGDEETFSQNGERLFWFDYDYDAQGNWVRKRIHHVGGVIEMTRTITYHDPAPG